MKITLYLSCLVSYVLGGAVNKNDYKDQFCTDPRTMAKHRAYSEWADAYSCTRHRCQPGGRNLAIYTVGCKRVEAPESAIECEEVVEDTNMQFPFCCTRLRCLVLVRGEVWTRVLGQPWETLPAAPWSHMYKMKKPPPMDNASLPKTGRRQDLGLGESEMTDEKFIELVKLYHVLYDMKLAIYRDHTARNNAWEEIAEQMNTHVEDIKNKWGKLRNCFTNALTRGRRKKSGEAATNIVPWKFEKQMEFLLPHIEGRSTVTNLRDANVDDSTQDSGLQFSEDSAISPPPTILHTPRTSSSASAESFTSRRTNKSDNDNNLIKEMIDVMKEAQDIRKKRSATDMDENDYFFLSMSKQLKKLPKTDQAEIKFQVHKLIHDSEIKM